MILMFVSLGQPVSLQYFLPYWKVKSLHIISEAFLCEHNSFLISGPMITFGVSKKLSHFVFLH